MSAQRCHAPRFCASICFARGELFHDRRTAAGQPVRVRQNDHRLGVVRRVGHDPLVERDDDFGHVAKRLGGLLEHIGRSALGQRLAADRTACPMSPDRW